MAAKTHWRRLSNPDYLGAYALEPGKDLIVTIKSVGEEKVTGTDGKKEECIVAHFEENVKPMILNATNCKTISKIYGTPYIEEWRGCAIQLYSAEVQAFGDTVEALRIRKYRPNVQSPEKPICADCGAEIKAFGKYDADYIAERNRQKYGKSLCAECAQKRADREKAEKPADPLAPDPEQTEQIEESGDSE